MKTGFFLFCNVLFFFIRAQVLHYDIELFGKKIGNSQVSRNFIDDSLTRYSLNSHSETTIFFVHRKVTLEYNIAYLRDKLLSAFSRNVRNDEVITVNTKLNGSRYEINKNNELGFLKSPILCSSVKYYFEEPCDGDKVFSERLGEFVPLKKTGEEEYECTYKEGITNVYRYINGKLVELEMKKGLFSAYLKLNQTLK